MMRGHIALSEANDRPQLSKKPKNSKPVLDHVRHTPMAELRHNYETVLSWLQPASITANRGNLHQEGRQRSSLPKSPELPSTRKRMSKHQSSSRSAPDLSALPSTKHRLPPGFVDEMLNSLVISEEVLERH